MTLVVAHLLAGCGDGDADGQGGSGTTGQTSSTGTGTGTTTGTGGPMCTDPAPQPGADTPVPVDMVTAIARDENDQTITDADFQLCGTDLCLYATTNAIGQATFSNTTGNPLDRPLFKPGDSLTFGKIGYPYTVGSPSPLPGIFPRMTDSAAALTPGTTVSVAGASLALPAGGAACVDTLIYLEPAQQTFRAASVPVALVDDVTGDPEFMMVYALGPVDTLLQPPAQLTVDNYANLPANADVEFWGQETSIEEFFGGYGEWVYLDDGTVSADGTTVTTATGLPVLLTIAIKIK